MQYRDLADGKFRDGLKELKDDTGKDHFGHFYPIAYDAVSQNEFLVVNQFSIEGKNKHRPDLLLFVNGLPLVLFEFKNRFDANATIEKLSTGQDHENGVQ
ncbi:hypothetical protein DXT99_22085 [Pontibacter diazotrophicus]|uniref:type I site-specific deoxyribonuclease n=1 Tax=Pontibacter diazotrophicus TaxID=1400979 RepID=A0A3D8L6C4_9BACT|nr:type I restriction endonuclease [Pontibacter diazotrophicus]RDV12960.1 hypothetical protein DXT99_22085 [Pontibacter diazotrophicus]